MTRVSKSKDQYFLLHPEKKGTMQLPVPIDEKSMGRLNEKLAEAASREIELEAKKAKLTAPINSELKEVRAQLKALDAERKSGQTMSEVEVEERASFELGVAWMVRMDTGLEVPDTRRELTHQERQAFAPGKDGEDPARILPRRGESAGEDDEEDPREAAEALFSKPSDKPPSEEPSVQNPEPAEEQPKEARTRGPIPLPAAKYVLPPPLSDYHALRFPPTGAISVYREGNRIGTARFDEGKDILVFTTGEADVPKKVADAILEACRFGELPNPGAPRPGQVLTAETEPASEGDGAAEPATETAGTAALKLTQNDAAALRALEKEGKPLSPERIGSLTRNRRPGMTAQRLQSAGYVKRLDGGLLEITEAGKKALMAPPEPEKSDESTAEPGGDVIPFGRE